MIQTDLFSKRESFRTLVERRLPVCELLVISDVASALNITRAKVLMLIEDGQIFAVNLNQGSSMRAFYKVVRSSVIDYAERLDKGW